MGNLSLSWKQGTRLRRFDMLASERVQHWVSRLRSATLGLLKSSVLWIADARLPLSHKSRTSSFCPCVVIGVEHYGETMRQLAVRSRRDVSAILRLETSSDIEQLAYVGPVENDQRKVRIFRLDQNFNWADAYSLFCIPESLVLSRALKQNEAFEVSRFGQRYFVTSDGHCQRAGGLIQDADRFRLARGTPALDVILIDEEAIPQKLLYGMQRLSMSDWLASLSPEIYRRVRAGWRPVAKLSASVLLSYLLLASGYLVAMSSYRQHQINKLGADVEQLLVAQREVISSEREINSLTSTLNNRREGWSAWSLVKAVWDKGGRVYGLTINEEGVVLRGVVADATQLLRDISAAPVYAAAQFDAPVTQTPEGQQFVIAIRSAVGATNAK